MTVPGDISQEEGPIPVAVIVGRPNVGKSSLFNSLARQRISIVDPMRGVTRDRVSTLITYADRTFELYDTGGIGLGKGDEFAAEINAQIEIALRSADVILFVVDAQAGFHPAESAIADRLREMRKPILLVANKVDHAKHESTLGEFHKLGLGEPIPVSAREGTGRTDLMESLLSKLPPRSCRVPDPSLRFAIVGRQNVGKSTLVNCLARQERMIVSEIPGTTRDSVDVRFEMDGETFIAIDTAGIKRKTRLRTSVEFYGLERAERAIRRSNVVLFMLDSLAEITNVDKRIAEQIILHARPCVITMNKWDLVGDLDPKKFIPYLNDRLPFLSYAPVAFISAKTGENVQGLIRLARDLHRQAQTQVPTPELNALIQQAQEERPIPAERGKSPKILYAVQVGIAPPTFVLFCRSPEAISETYTRYLTNFLRKHIPSCAEIPFRLFYRKTPRRQ